MRVVVGRLGRAHGIRGEITVEVRTDAPEERFSPGAVLFAQPGPRGVPGQLEVVDHRWQGGRLVLRVAGVADRAAAEALRGTVLEADVEASSGADDEYHDLVLVGLAVRDASGHELGRIAEVLHLPGQDLLAVRRPEAGELLVPFVKALVPVVDPAGGYVIVELPAGLDGLDPPRGGSGSEAGS